MTTDLRRHESPATALDYYLILAEPWAGGPQPQADGIAVEEFTHADDHTATGLDNAVWTAADGEWWSAAAFSRAIRADPALRARTLPVPRRDAELAYLRLGGGTLPDEPALRAHFRDHALLSGSSPLLLTPAEAPEGCREKRVYRILFAGDLRIDRLPHLQRAWDMTLADDFDAPRARVLGSARLRAAEDLFTWDLRRVGQGLAWSVDLTAYLADPPSQSLGPLLRELTTTMRYQGLIPATIERFS